MNQNEMTLVVSVYIVLIRMELNKQFVQLNMNDYRNIDSHWKFIGKCK